MVDMFILFVWIILSYALLRLKYDIKKIYMNCEYFLKTLSLIF